MSLPFFLSWPREVFLYRENVAKVVSGFALALLLILFVRTLLWVLDGIFYTQPPQIRIFEIVFFLLVSGLLWKLLEFQMWARRAFLLLLSVVWVTTLAEFLRTFHQPVVYNSSLKITEYLFFILWAVVGPVFAVYLLQPRVRSLFTYKGNNLFLRGLTISLLVGLFVMEYRHAQGWLPLNYSDLPTISFRRA